MRLAVLLLVAACGSDPDITGLYMTTAHEVSDTACSGGTTPDVSPAYFRIEERDLLGATYYTRTNCATEPDMCSGGGGILAEETDDGYRGETYLAIGDASACTLAFALYDASLDGDELTFETVNYSESGAIDPCTTDEAQARGDGMPCAGYERIVGVRAED